MRRIFPDYTYGPGPRRGCWWDDTIAAPDWPRLQGSLTVDVAIVGGGFTGLSAALHLAQAGVSVAVLEGGSPGWGASGRNGGFCCLGGSKLDHQQLTRRYGPDAANAYAQAEEDAVQLVAQLLQTHGIDADTHSRGETLLAHSSRAMERLRRSADPSGILHEADMLPELGLGGAFYGGYTTLTGFALNPRKYLFGLATAAWSQGAQLFQNSPAERIERTRTGFDIQTRSGQVRAAQVLICTNGYSSEDLPGWLSARYMPAQSTVLVTRPLTDQEINAQGWTSGQMAYDTRHLLHYFRMMPDRRFLFGMRGGLLSSDRHERAIGRKVLADFHSIFPAWRAVEVTHMWSGLVCLSRSLTPFAGPVPGQPGMFAGLAYHGNGVAMGSYCGRALARMALGQDSRVPDPISQPLRRFPLGGWRRALMPPAYALMSMLDR